MVDVVVVVVVLSVVVVTSVVDVVVVVTVDAGRVVVTCIVRMTVTVLHPGSVGQALSVLSRGYSRGAAYATVAESKPRRKRSKLFMLMYDKNGRGKKTTTMTEI